MGLPHEEIRAVLARAAEIERGMPSTRADLEAVIDAAVEVGIPRHAVERALRERLTMPMRPPAVGNLVFAKSADDKFYVAEVLSASDDAIHARFLRGGEHTVSLDELRPCSFLPGERVVCRWPWWGPWTCTVMSYDAANQRVTVTDGWGETATFPISEVWLAPRKTAAGRRTRVYAALIGLGATAGAALGSLLTMLFLR